MANAMTSSIVATLRPLAVERGFAMGLRFWDGSSETLGSGPARLVLRFPRPEAAWRLAHPDLGSLAKAYITGEFDVEGPAADLVRLAVELATARAPRRRLPSLWRWNPLRHTLRRDRAAISHHYDVSNDFYRLWLDARMVYSCACFPTGEETLDAAQEAKLDLICRKLQLQPGDRFLDIGCGWGALLFWAQQHYGVRATGVTLSTRQFEHVRQCIRERGLEGSVAVHLQDYRQIPGERCFDKIASVGMLEHVGVRNLPGFAGAISRLLTDDGLVLNHGITTRPGDEDVRESAGEFIDRFVFPGGELPSMAQLADAMEHQQLEVFDVEGLRPHYARTLSHWVERLEARRDEAVGLVGERIYRTWRVYMAGSMHAFERGWISVHQLLAAKRARPGLSRQRWSRAHMLGPAAGVATAGAGPSRERGTGRQA